MITHKSVLVPSSFYHVRNQAVGSEKLFAIEENYFYFLGLFRKYILPVAEVFSFTLLPDNFQFLIQIRDPFAIWKQMRKIKYRYRDSENIHHIFLLQQFSNFFNAYTKAFNKQQQRKGRLFVEPFSRKTLANPAYFTRLICNIHAAAMQYNSLSENYVWPHTSYHHYLNTANSWIEKRKVIGWFGSHENFIRIHEEMFMPELNTT